MEWIVEWNENEYIPELGCYIKWLHGDPSQQVQKLYCMSAFHFFTNTSGFVKHTEYYKYAEYLNISVRSIISSTTDWNVRIYIDESILTESNPETPVWISTLNELIKLDRIQIICVKMPRYYIPEQKIHQGLLAVMFRYLALFDKNTSIMLFRDIDNIWTEQHHYFVETWLNSDKDIFLFMNQYYKRQQIEGLTKDDVKLENIYYLTILSGLWNIRKPMGNKFSYKLWHKMFAYHESYTDFVNLPQYKECKYYKIRFIYGFDELILTRVTLPLLLESGLSIYALPIKIYDESYLQNLFDEAVLKKFLKVLSTKENIEIVRKIALENYWHMTATNAGLSEYILCLLTNIYYHIITRKSNYYKNDIFINSLKYKVYPVPLLMGLGLFTFKNYSKYNWYKMTGYANSGSEIVKKFISSNSRLTIEDLTANSDLSNNGDGPNTPPYGI